VSIPFPHADSQCCDASAVQPYTARVKRLNGISSFVWFTECVTSNAGMRGAAMRKAGIIYTAPPPDVKARPLCGAVGALSKLGC